MSQQHCRELFDKMSAYLDGELEQDMVDRIERHVQGCSRCKECLESVRTVRELLRKAPSQKIPPDLKEKLINCMKDV